MANVKVERTNQGTPYQFLVTVQEGGTSTQHRVTLAQADYARLSGGQAGPEALVEASFHYLLEREPKESILRSFDLTVISRYFPGYEREIANRL
jgi:hypothetical protein